MKKLDLKKGNIINNVLLYVGCAVLVLGLVFFTLVNKALLFDVAWFCVIFFGIACAGLLLSVVLVGVKMDTSKGRILSSSATIISIAMFGITVIYTFAGDFFQPLMLSTLSMVLLLVGGVTVSVCLLISLVLKGNVMRIVAIACTLFCLSLSGVIWANTQGYGDFVQQHITLFSNGEGGYTTFRIPSLCVADRDVISAHSDLALDGNVVIALAEGRRNSSKDIGDIDIVYKVSNDGGANWTPLQTLLSVDGEVGKVGNPTILFDRFNGSFYIFYMVGTQANGYNYVSYAVQGTLNADLSISLAQPVLLTTNYDANAGIGKGDGVNQYTIMFGPGKAVQLDDGRIVLPCSNKGYSYAMYSTDGGQTWHRGENAIDGNECEIAVLQDGSLIMVSRSNTTCSSFHNNECLRFALSNDGGQTWHTTFDMPDFKTPCCMTSIATNGAHLIITGPDDFYTRANLTLAVSNDNGATCTKTVLYSGASGYSCVDSDQNTTYVLAEIGKVNYNEALVFFRIPNSTLW